MYKTTFGSKIHYVITLTLIFLTLSAWTSGELYAQISITEDSTTNATCPDSSDGAINISINGGTPNYNYEWEGPGTYSSISQDISGLKAGSYTVTVTDSSTSTPQSASKTITIEGIDSIKPTISAPADIQGSTDPSNCNTSNINLGTPTTNDNCGVASLTHDAPSNFPLGPTTVTWTVTDNSGNTATATQEVIISDNTDPTITAPADIQADSDPDDCNASSVNLGIETANDNCGIASITNDAPAFFPLGETVVTWTVTDNTGNKATDTQKVTVIDKTKPVITAGDDVEATNDTGLCEAGLSIAPATATDNCTVGNPAGTRSDGLALNAAYPVGTTTITWNVTDENNNDATTVTQTVTVTDNEAPVITHNGDKNVSSDTGACDAAVSVSASATDNCTVGNPAGTRSDGLALDAAYPLGTTTITWNVTDENNNDAATVTQTVTVTDNEAPVITHNGDKNVSSDMGACDAAVSVSASATDNCTVGNPAGTRSDGLALNAAYPVGTTTITWNVTDENGNSADVVIQEVIIEDNEAPSLPDVEDIFWGCEYTVDTPIAMDNCDGEIVGSPDRSTTFSTSGSITWTFTDGAGNFSQLTQTVVIDELEVEVIVTNVECNGLTTGKAEATATGGVIPYTYSWTTLGSGDSKTNLGAGIYELTVTDANGCQVVKTVEISEPDALNVTEAQSTPTSCFGPDGTDGTINAGTVSGGTPPYLYSINNSDFDASVSFTGLTAGDYTVFIKDNNDCAIQQQIKVEEPAQLKATLAKTNVSCFEGNDGTITLSNINGGSGNYEFSKDGTSWQNSSPIENLEAGSYPVYIRDASSPYCEVLIETVKITEPTKLTVTATSTRTQSYGSSTGTAQAFPSGGSDINTYEWREVGNAAIIKTTNPATNLSAGNYEVTVIDKNGCSATNTVTVIDALFAEIQSGTICEDEGNTEAVRTGYFKVSDLTAIGGVGPYEYSWTFGDTATPSSAIGPGEHAVTYSSTGNKTTTLTITDSQGEVSIINREQYVGKCYEPCGKSENFEFDPTAIYIGDANGNEIDFTLGCVEIIDKYLYLPVEKSANIYNPYIEVIYGFENNLSNSTYEAQYDEGCRDGDNIDDDPTDNKDNKVGDFIRLTVDPIDYSCGDALEIENFYITWTNVSKKDCGRNNNAFCYSVNEPVVVPTAVSVQGTPTPIRCKSESTGIINAKGSGGFAPYTYNITGLNDTFYEQNFFNGLLAGTYNLYIKDSRGNTASTTVIIEEPEEAIGFLEVTGTNPECAGGMGSASATATGGTPFETGDSYTYLWNDPSGQTTAAATDLAAGTYTVTVTDANGCQAIESVTITEPIPLTIADAGEDQDLGCGVFSTTLEANTADIGIGEWSIDVVNSSTGGNFTDATIPNSSFSGPAGSYSLIWTISNVDGTCVNSDTVTINLGGNCNSLDFDGVDDHVIIDEENKGTYGFTSGAFTMEVWVKPESVSGVKTVISKRDKSNLNAGGFDLIINNGAPTFRWRGKSATTSKTIKTDRWYHLAVVFQNSNAQIYIDGIKLGTATASNPAIIDAPFIIGAMFDSAATAEPKNNFDGWIEELRLWKTALTEEQLHFLMNQRVESNGTLVKGHVLPMDAPSNLSYNNLIGYYKLLVNEILDGETPDISSTSKNGVLRNILTEQKNSAPLPYISEIDGSWRNRTTWDTNIGNDQEKWWDVPNGVGINGDYINWNIVKTSHNINSSTQDIYLLGLLSESQELKIDGNVPNQTGQGLTISHYLKLDGTINLEGNSQLVQTEGSILDESSSGYIDIDQQGTANSFNYNYWTSPVSLISQLNNYGYSLLDVLMDGSNPANPQGLSFNYQYHWADGNYSGTKRISTYWLYTFKGNANDYSEWHQFGESELLKPGIGYSMKGTTGYVPVNNRQNYTFRGKPNNGDISLSIGSGQNLLTGNPYPSAIDAKKFIEENLSSFNGALYFWDHFGAINSHILKEYVGGYAVYNLSGGIASASSIDSRINPTGDQSTKAPPGRYIPVGQAFFVSSVGISTPANLTYKNRYRAFVPESTPDSQFHSQEKDPKKSQKNTYEKDSRFKIRLKFESPKGYHRQILVTADANASGGFDLGYDAPLIENNVEDMYWMIDETEFVIQAVPNFNLDQVLPLGIKLSEEGEYTIKIDELENIKTDFNIYLKDNLNDTYTNLSKEDYITTAEELGYFNERYEIVFKKQVAEKPIEEIPEELEEPQLGLNYLRNTDEIAVLNPDLLQVDHVELYSISGQLIKSFQEVPTERSILLSIDQKLSSAVYIVKMYSGEKVYSRKVIITK